MRRCALVLVLMFAVACGGGSGPTAPQGPQYPAVAGSYAGTVTMAFPELGQSITCPATTSVAQTNASVSIAPIILAGACGGISIPLGSMTIDQNGSLGTATSFSYTEPSCGVYNGTVSGGFFGQQFQISINATSTTCYNFNFTASLTR